MPAAQMRAQKSPIPRGYWVVPIGFKGPIPLTNLYVIKCEGYFKIGLAKDVSVRLSGLRAASPFEMSLDYAVPVPMDLAGAAERRCHIHLQEWWVRGEWFSCDGDLARLAVDEAAAAARQAAATRPVGAKRRHMRKADGRPPDYVAALLPGDYVAYKVRSDARQAARDAKKRPALPDKSVALPPARV